MHKDDVVRDAILQAAERVFQRWGINKTTMEDIASEAGKGKSTLYYYYKSKEEIFDAVVIIEFGKILEKAREATNEVKSAKEKLIKYIIVSINEMKNKIAVYTIIHEEIKRNQNFIEKIRKFFDSKERQFIKDILKLGMDNKEFTFFNENELNIAAKTIMGIIHALELYLLLESDDTKQIDIAAKLIANGI
jgi:AcrR family transcriptional regulator